MRKLLESKNVIEMVNQLNYNEYKDIKLNSHLTGFELKYLPWFVLG